MIRFKGNEEREVVEAILDQLQNTYNLIESCRVHLDDDLCASLGNLTEGLGTGSAVDMFRTIKNVRDWLHAHVALDNCFEMAKRKAGIVEPNLCDVKMDELPFAPR